MEKRIPVVVIEKKDDTVKILSSIEKYGIHTAEITLRTECAIEAIELGVKAFPAMTIGAGTVLDGQQCKKAIDAGARFIVSPGLSEEVAVVCSENNIPYYPGCVTPTEIMHALKLGITTVKFFPADIYGGLAALKALSAPFPMVRFIPTGGINSDNIDEFLAFDRVAAVGGSFFVKEALKNE